MNLLPTLMNYGTILSIIIRVISSVILLFFFIPLQIKEAFVRNGLKKLRIQLLIIGIIILITNVLTGYILWEILVTYTRERLDNVMAQLLNAIAYLILSVIFYQMYKFQYSEQSKEFHKKIDELREKHQMKEAIPAQD